MLDQDITEIRKARHAITQEDFTPEEIVKILYQEFPEELYIDFSKTILDPCAGIGNLLLYCIIKRIGNCNTPDDVYDAISTIYGTELMEDNVQEMHQRFLFKILELTTEKGWDLSEKKILDILKHNIVCSDTFKWDYQHWKPKVEETYTSVALF